MKLKNSKLPLYHQLAEKITEEIKDNNLAEDEKIPSEREYCEKYKVSRSTVREAVKYLEQTGYLYRIQGKGTFVSPKMMKQNLLEFYSFTEEMKKLGKTPSSIIKSFKVITADKETAKKLNIQNESKIYYLERIRLADDIPIMLEKTFLPASRFPRLSKNDFVKNPMYTVFINEYNVTFEKAVEKFLNREISFLDIYEIIEFSMGNHKIVKNPSVEEILEIELETYKNIESRW